MEFSGELVQMSDSMPSKNTALKQELAELSDDMVRRLALKDAEIAAATLAIGALRETVGLREANIAALTEQRDDALAARDGETLRAQGANAAMNEAIQQRDAAQRERDAHALWNKRHREQRDRALEAVEMARRVQAALNIALAALDTPSSPSLPESPIDG